MKLSLILLVAFLAAVEASSKNCQDHEKTFSQVLEYVSALAASKSDWKCIRVDLMIVASTKQVHHATFYPSTGFGSTSSFKRTPDGHLREIETFTSGENNIFKLFDQDISGNHTLEISNGEKILLTACAKYDKPNASNCRMKVDETLKDNAMKWISENKLDTGKSWKENIKGMTAVQGATVGDRGWMDKVKDFFGKKAAKDDDTLPGPPRCPLPEKPINRFICPTTA